MELVVALLFLTGIVLHALSELSSMLPTARRPRTYCNREIELRFTPLESTTSDTIFAASPASMRRRGLQGCPVYGVNERRTLFSKALDTSRTDWEKKV